MRSAKNIKFKFVRYQCIGGTNCFHVRERKVIYKKVNDTYRNGQIQIYKTIFPRQIFLPLLRHGQELYFVFNRNVTSNICFVFDRNVTSNICFVFNRNVTSNICFVFNGNVTSNMCFVFNGNVTSNMCFVFNRNVTSNMCLTVFVSSESPCFPRL
jgi:hypothetical protein